MNRPGGVPRGLPDGRAASYTVRLPVRQSQKGRPFGKTGTALHAMMEPGGSARRLIAGRTVRSRAVGSRPRGVVGTASEEVMP